MFLISVPEVVVSFTFTLRVRVVVAPFSIGRLRHSMRPVASLYVPSLSALTNVVPAGSSSFTYAELVAASPSLVTSMA